MFYRPKYDSTIQACYLYWFGLGFCLYFYLFVLFVGNKCRYLAAIWVLSSELFKIHIIWDERINLILLLLLVLCFTTTIRFLKFCANGMNPITHGHQRRGCPFFLLLLLHFHFVAGEVHGPSIKNENFAEGERSIAVAPTHKNEPDTWLDWTMGHLT